MPRRQLRGFDLKRLAGFSQLIGVDEAGRGALAGPVVAAAVLIGPDFLESRWVTQHGARINDSKQVTAEERAALWDEFDGLARAGKIHATWGVAEVGEIEVHNILGATKLAMRRALEGIYPPAAFVRQVEPDLFTPVEEAKAFQPTVSCRVLVDGLPLRNFAYPHDGIVNGDSRSLCIAMASIVAKVTRDRLMNELHEQFSHYGFAQHKGYGTEEHRAALLKHGKCRHHREMFLRKLFAGHEDPAQLDFFAEES